MPTYILDTDGNISRDNADFRDMILSKIYMAISNLEYIFINNKA